MKFALLAATVLVLAGCAKEDVKVLRCDFNSNGVIDASDLGFQQNAFGQPSTVYDVTSDGLVLGEDIVICQKEFDGQAK